MNPSGEARPYTSAGKGAIPVSVLEVVDLNVYYKVGRERLHAVADVTLALPPGHTLAVVGESGSGKSTLARTIALLQRPTTGIVRFDGVDVAHGHDSDRFRRNVQYVFQDPAGALDPRWTAGRSLSEPWLLHGFATRRTVGAHVAELLDLVGLPRALVNRYPHEMSGGQRQRVGLARALALRPRILILDEPVSAVDVSAQAQVVTLLQDLQEEMEVSYVFIAHDLPLVRLVADDVAVMYLGRIVEFGPRDAIYGQPSHPYTEALLAAVPVIDPRLRGTRKRVVLDGDPPSPLAVMTGCAFRTRCPRAQDICSREAPALTPIGPGHRSACHFPSRPAKTPPQADPARVEADPPTTAKASPS